MGVPGVSVRTRQSGRAGLGGRYTKVLMKIGLKAKVNLLISGLNRIGANLSQKWDLWVRAQQGLKRILT